MIDLDRLAKLLVELDAVGVKKMLPEGDNLRLIPSVAIPPDLLTRVKAHKADLLEALRPLYQPAAPSGEPDPFAGWDWRQDARGNWGWQRTDLPVVDWELGIEPDWECPACSALLWWQDLAGRNRCLACERAEHDRAVRLADCATWLRRQSPTAKTVAPAACPCVAGASVELGGLGVNRPTAGRL